MILVVLPAYNEASCIGALLESYCEVIEGKNEKFRIIVVDDGSTDGTGKVVLGFSDRLPLELITHPGNRGLAEALRTGLHRALEVAGDRDVIVTMDADNSHLPGLLPRMVALVREGHDVVIASRYQKGAVIKGVSGFRQVLSLGAGFLFRCILPLKGARDYTCGYRAYRASILRRAFADYGEAYISEKGFSCMVDLLLKLRRYDPIITEVPIILRYDQKTSDSKMNVAKTVRQTLRLLVRRRLGL